ncbi:MAG: tRNA lysidine(34) synthetase TilS [Lachnospiraceae bacterium]|nr:tRNA lysidine(34) synthetase TilS [Lachnospiraceae bacterium]
MIERVYQYIEKYHMIQKGDTVIAGVSGGADSVCLFHVLLKLSQTMGFTLWVVHVEHGIRGKEALRDMEFVKALCKSHNITCSVYHYDVRKLAKEQKLTEEEAGRKVRYESFELEKQKCGGPAKIAVAHNMNDNAETLLMHLIRGSGLKGLCGMEAVRGNIIRPLLFVDREEIEGFLDKIGQEYCNDSTNLTTDYARNKVRLQILPELLRINSKAVQHIHQAAGRLEEANRFLQHQSDIAYEDMVVKEKGQFFFQVKALQQADDYLKGEVVKRVLTECAGSSRNLGSIHVDAVLSLLHMESGKKLSLPYNITAQRVYDRLRIWQGGDQTESEEIGVLITKSGQYNISEREETFLVSIEMREKNKKNVNKQEKTCTKCFDYDKIKNGLVIRTRRTGDYLIIDEEGHRQSLKSFFINEKIEREMRNQILLVADGSHILWVVNYRSGMGCRVDEDTKRILKIQRLEGLK